MAWSFAQQLKVGNEGERLFLANYHAPIIKISHKDKAGDFRRVDDWSLVELKTDTYQMDKTPNLFFEHTSNVEKGTPGGPWRTLKEGVDHFCYHYIKNKTYFEFSDVAALCSELDAIISGGKAKAKTIPNRGFLTIGYVVPRERVAKLCREFKYNQ